MEMKKPIRLMLAAADSSELQTLAQQLYACPEIKICSCITDEATLSKAMEKRKPDALLIDLVQSTPQNQPLLLTYQKIAPRPPVLFYGLSAVPSWIQQAASCGRTYYLNKPASLEAIVARLHMLSDRQEHGSMAVAAPAPSNDSTPNIAVQACRLLKKIGIPPHLCGYRFLKEAIVQVCQAPCCMQAMTTRIYQPIARENQLTVSQVERSMRYAIEYAFNRGNLDAIESIFGFTINSAKGKPSNSECIAMLADHLHRW